MYPSLASGISQIRAKGGFSTTGLFTGGAPTLIGYSVQGMCKFGFYEMFKDVYKNIAGENADRFRVIGWAVSSACAEVIADIGLCPMEAVKVRMQTAPEGTFPTELGAAISTIRTAEGIFQNP
jgi:solute carrier family 25 phosphate transporter 3